MVSKKEAIIALLLNVFILPGLGTVIWGKRKHGIWQLVLFGVGVVTVIILVGFLLVLVAWIWALISGINLVQHSK